VDVEHRSKVLAASDAEPSMREIARLAGVGVATLYRHFPTREALVDAVYQDQVVRLTTGAFLTPLGRVPSAGRPALRCWGAG